VSSTCGDSADSAGRLDLYYTFVVIPVILPFYFWQKRQPIIAPACELDYR